jgi:hypothetical protein
MYTDAYQPQGIEHELMLILPARPGKAADPGRTLQLFLFRGPGADFSGADRPPPARRLGQCRSPLGTAGVGEAHAAELDPQRQRRRAAGVLDLPAALIPHFYAPRPAPSAAANSDTPRRPAARHVRMVTHSAAGNYAPSHALA